jgi:hypothetical protein
VCADYEEAVPLLGVKRTWCPTCLTEPTEFAHLFLENVEKRTVPEMRRLYELMRDTRSNSNVKEISTAFGVAPCKVRCPLLFNVTGCHCAYSSLGLRLGLARQRYI